MPEDPNEALKRKIRKRKYTYQCDWNVPVEIPPGMQIVDPGYGALGRTCGKPARRIYVGEFGAIVDLWYCDTHLEMYFAKKVVP